MTRTVSSGKWRVCRNVQDRLNTLSQIDVGSVGIETSILPEGDTFFSFRLCMVIFPAKATNNPHGLGVRLTIAVCREYEHVL